MPARILLVEDDLDLRELLVLALEHDGRYAVTSCGDGVDAVVKLEFARPFDAVLLNLRLPIMDGADVLDLIRSDPRHAGLPVVLVTGSPVPADVARSADAIVRKPFDLGELTGAIDRAMLAQRPPRRQSL